MNAIYPQALRSFPAHVDYSELVDADHVNELQDEVSAIEAVLGVMPASYAPPGSGSGTAYKSVGARLDAHESAMAAQQVQINQMLAASKVGWATPALSVSGFVTPGVRAMPVTGFLDLGPTPVPWTAETVNVGGMYVPNATTVAVPAGGLWSVTATIVAPIDWTTLTSVQNTYNGFGLSPVPLAFQRLAVGIWINGAEQAYSHHDAQFLAPAVRPSITIVGGNPPHLGNLGADCTYQANLATGTQIVVKAEQYYGAIASATVTMSARYIRAVDGVA